METETKEAKVPKPKKEAKVPKAGPKKKGTRKPAAPKPVVVRDVKTVLSVAPREEDKAPVVDLDKMNPRDTRTVEQTTTPSTTRYLGEFERVRAAGLLRLDMNLGGWTTIADDGIQRTVNELVDEQIRQSRIPVVFRRRLPGNRVELVHGKDLKHTELFLLNDDGSLAE